MRVTLVEDLRKKFSGFLSFYFNQEGKANSRKLFDYNMHNTITQGCLIYNNPHILNNSISKPDTMQCDTFL